MEKNKLTLKQKIMWGLSIAFVIFVVLPLLSTIPLIIDHWRYEQNMKNASTSGSTSDTTSNSTDTTTNNTNTNDKSGEKLSTPQDYANWFPTEDSKFKEDLTNASESEMTFLNSFANPMSKDRNDAKTLKDFNAAINYLRQFINSSFTFPEPDDSYLRQYDTTYRNGVEQLPDVFDKVQSAALTSDSNTLNQLMNEQKQLGAQIELAENQISADLSH